MHGIRVGQRSVSPLNAFSRIVRRTGRPPLRPSECALALLPIQGRRYLPTPIQHLMDPKSPIGDLFKECEQCVQFSKEIVSLQRELATVMEQLMELRERLSKREGSLETNTQNKLEALETQSSEIRQRIRYVPFCSSFWNWI